MEFSFSFLVKYQAGKENLGRGHTKETGNRNVQEFCLPKLNTWKRIEQHKLG
jgi:hypothetical protein